jgi:hypothetical protein
VSEAEARRRDAAVEDMAEDEDPVRVEESVDVYLTWDPVAKRWELDPLMLDGYALDTHCETGPHLEPGSDEPQHLAMRAEAAAASFPDAEDLLRLLADALGYELVRRG